MPFYALFINLWGAFNIEMWRRKNARLSFEWDTNNFQESESELPRYILTKKQRNKTKPHTKWEIFFYRNETRLKFFMSFIVFLVMVRILNLKPTDWSILVC